MWAKSTPGVHDAWHPSLLCCGDIREGPSFDCVAMETYGCAVYCKRITTGFRNLGLFSCIVCSQQSSLPISVLPSVTYSSELNDGPPLLIVYVIKNEAVVYMSTRSIYKGLYTRECSSS